MKCFCFWFIWRAFIFCSCCRGTFFSFMRFLWSLYKIFSINFFLRWLTCFQRCFATFFKWKKVDIVMICYQRCRRRCISTHASMHSLFYFNFEWQMMLILDIAVFIAWSIIIINFVVTTSMLFLFVKASALKLN